MTYRYRMVEKEDIWDIVDVHIDSFPKYFLTEMGRAFLKTYYRSYLFHDSFIAICVEDSRGVICGFCFGTTKSSGYSRRLIIGSIFSYAVLGVLLLATKPISLYHIYRNFSKTGDKDEKRDYAEILSLGVTSSHQGKGLGRKLVERFEGCLLEKNLDKVSLTTDLDNNDNAKRFYDALGYEKIYSFTAFPERNMLRLIKNLQGK